MASSSSKDSTKPVTPSIESWLHAVLYKKAALTWPTHERMLEPNEAIDSYCPKCRAHSVFKTEGHEVPFALKYHSQKEESFDFYRVVLRCARNIEHTIVLFFQRDGEQLVKAGQFPSRADVSLPDFDKYAAVLSEASLAELKRGVALAAHDVGIGAFVYLRRVFEKLIDDARVERENFDALWDAGLFIKSKMDERIRLLKDDLPDFLIQHRSLYGIMSKGIHELSEEQCIDAFPTVQLGIELILDDALAKRQKALKIKKASTKIGELNGRLKGIT